MNDHQRKMARKAGKACGYADGGRVRDALDDELDDVAPLPEPELDKETQEGMLARRDAAEAARKRTAGRVGEKLGTKRFLERNRKNETEMNKQREEEDEADEVHPRMRRAPRFWQA